EEIAEKIEGLVRIEITVEIRFFGQITDASLGRNVARRMAENFNVPFGWVEQAENEFYGSGFARTIGAEQTENFAATDFKVHVVNGARFWPAPEVFEDFRQATYRNDSFGGLVIGNR